MCTGECKIVHWGVLEASPSSRLTVALHPLVLGRSPDSQTHVADTCRASGGPPGLTAWRSQRREVKEPNDILAAPFPRSQGAVAGLATALGRSDTRGHVRSGRDRATPALGQDLLRRVSRRLSRTQSPPYKTKTALRPLSVGQLRERLRDEDGGWNSGSEGVLGQEGDEHAVRAPAAVPRLFPQPQKGRPVSPAGDFTRLLPLQVFAAGDPVPSAVRAPPKHRPALWLIPYAPLLSPAIQPCTQCEGVAAVSTAVPCSVL